jgi:hypothetical protein
MQVNHFENGPTFAALHALAQARGAEPNSGIALRAKSIILLHGHASNTSSQFAKKTLSLVTYRNKNFGTQISQIDADFGHFPKNQHFQRLSAPHFAFSEGLPGSKSGNGDKRYNRKEMADAAT